jgi:polysaccharide pyruvyl transferase WcaK-like protein
MPSGRPRAVITNVYADDNRGGAALTAAAVQAVRRGLEDPEVVVISTTSDPGALPSAHRHVIDEFPGVEVRPALLGSGGARTPASVLAVVGTLVLPRAAARRLPGAAVVGGAAVVVVKGGEMLRQRRGRELLALVLACYPLLLARRLGRPAVVLGQSFGPFTSRAAGVLSAALLRRADHVLLRDDASLQRARSAGISPARSSVAPDTVFTLAPPSPAEVRCAVDLAGLAGLRWCAVTVNERMARSPWRESVTPALVRVVTGLLEADLVDRVVVVLQTDGDRISDRRASEAFVAACGDPRVVLDDADRSWRELSALYGGAGLVVGGRLHSALLAVLAGTPALALELRGSKASEVLTEGDRPDWAVDLRRGDPAAVVELCATLMTDATRAATERLRDELGIRSRSAAADALARSRR